VPIDSELLQGFELVTQMDVSVGVGPPATTVNVMGPFVLPGTTTVTFRAVSAAPAVIVKVALICVSLTTTNGTGLPAVAPRMPPPLTLTAVAPLRPVPVIVTITVVPGAPVLGLMESRPFWPAPWNSTAPTSK
jgi:hypothetical protein